MNNPTERVRLIVEDNKTYQRLFTTVSARAGLGVVCVGTVADGLLQMASRDFSDVITDGHLPDGDCTRIVDEANSRGIQVTVVSGTVDGGRAETIARARGVTYFKKTAPGLGAALRELGNIKSDS